MGRGGRAMGPRPPGARLPPPPTARRPARNPWTPPAAGLGSERCARLEKKTNHSRAAPPSSSSGLAPRHPGRRRRALRRVPRRRAPRQRPGLRHLHLRAADTAGAHGPPGAGQVSRVGVGAAPRRRPRADGGPTAARAHRPPPAPAPLRSADLSTWAGMIATRYGRVSLDPPGAGGGGPGPPPGRRARRGGDRKSVG